MKIGTKSWSNQCRLVIFAAVIKIVNVIKFCRNNKRFNNRRPIWSSVLALVIIILLCVPVKIF